MLQGPARRPESCPWRGAHPTQAWGREGCPPTIQSPAPKRQQLPEAPTQPDRGSATCQPPGSPSQVTRPSPAPGVPRPRTQHSDSGSDPRTSSPAQPSPKGLQHHTLHPATPPGTLSPRSETPPGPRGPADREPRLERPPPPASPTGLTHAHPRTAVLLGGAPGAHPHIPAPGTREPQHLSVSTTRQQATQRPPLPQEGPRAGRAEPSDPSSCSGGARQPPRA